jgi:putative membrane protein
MMGGMMGGSGFGFGGLGLVGMILNLVITLGVIVGIVMLVVWLVRRVGSEGPGSQRAGGGQLPPREILQVRYARGEITREQYQQMLTDLS